VGEFGEEGGAKERERGNLQPMSMASTSLSLTVRSTVLRVSLVASAMFFWTLMEVENAARGAEVARVRGTALERVAMRRAAASGRKDMVVVLVVIWCCGCWVSCNWDWREYRVLSLGW
jgi:hypothetical protein